MIRIAPAWLSAPETQAVFAALLAAGGEARAVGGAVRDALLGIESDDVDVATSLTPAQAKAACAAAGFATYDTGIDHGTITVVSGVRRFEVTTLRCDVATDGRHAEVAFTTDWEADAARRDLTINALSCDVDGRIFDPFDGMADLDAGRVRFIGDAAMRIREDYLRILRFFRFSARFARGALDAQGLAACGSERDGLKRLSAERVRREVLQMLVATRAADVAETMHAHGFWPPLLGCVVAPRHLTRVGPMTRDPLVRLAALAVGTREHAEAIAARLKMSRLERDRLCAMANGAHLPWATISNADLRRAVFAMGCETALAALAVAMARTGDAETWTRHREAIDAWTPPVLPLSGRDLLAAGVAPGPELGRRLARAEAAWIASDFSLTRTALLGLVTAPDA
jgi:tRNA nucleotidyltransferase/poly(A) polymerase